MPFVQTTATVVTIFAGINEVNVVTAALGGGAGGSDPNGYIDAQVQAFGDRLRDAARRHQGARRLAAHHRLNVPNAAGLPYLARASLAQRQAAQRAAVGMTRTVVNPLLPERRSSIDLMCDARSYLASQLLVATACIRTMPATRSSPPKSSGRSRPAPTRRRKAAARP